MSNIVPSIAQNLPRIAEVQRNTAETRVAVRVNLDGTGKASLNSGIGFLDHMLTLLTFHSDFDLKIIGHGDHETVGMDPHHLIEDVAIALGKCISEALGNKLGIQRYGSFTIPMDEALVTCDLDISGRPYLVFNADLSGSNHISMNSRTSSPGTASPFINEARMVLEYFNYLSKVNFNLDENGIEA